MRTYSLDGLFRLTRAELTALYAKLLADLAGLTDPSERELTLATLALIRRALSCHGPSP